MVAYYFTLGINIVFSIIGIGVTLRLYLSFDRKIQIILLMTGVMSSWLLSNSLLLVGSLTSSTYQYFLSFSQVFLILTFAIFVLFTASYSGGLNILKLSTAISFPVIVLTLWMTELVTGDPLLVFVREVSGYYFAFWRLGLFFMAAIGIILTGYWAIRTFTENLAYAQTDNQVSLLNMMRLGAFLAFLVGPFLGFPGYIIARIGSNNQLAITLFYIIGYSVISLGVLLMTLSYSLSDELAFLFPQRAEILMVIHKSGISIFSYDFRIKPTEVSSWQLISGLISAITTLMHEAFGISSDIREITFNNRFVLIQIEENAAFVVVTQQKSWFLTHAFEQFVTLFLDEYGHIIKNDRVHNVVRFNGIIPTLHQTFGIKRHKKAIAS